MIFISKFKSLGRILSALIGCALVLLPSVSAVALTAQDSNSLLKDTVWYDPTAAQATCSPATNNLTPGPVYFVGDSIGVKINSELTTDFVDKGWRQNIDALSNRLLSGTPPSPDGLSAIDTPSNQEFIKQAKAVIVELGTNPAGFTTANVNKIADKIHSLAPSAQLYWIDTAVIDSQRTGKPSLSSDLSNVNNIIYSQSNPKNYSVISWNKAVLGDNADPQNINPSAKDINNYIDSTDHLGINPNAKGIKALSELILSSVTTDDSIGGTGCSCTTSLTGNSPADKVWNYFKDASKNLSDAQVAGIMGNMQQESGFDPERMQIGGDSKDPYDAKDLGWGLIQWSGNGSSGRSTGEKFYGLYNASGLKGPVYELATQLDLVWQHMNNHPVVTQTFSLADYRQIASASAAAIYFNQHIEAGTDPNGVRETNAEAILKTYGGSGGGSTGGCGTSPNCQAANGTAKILCAAKVYDPVSYQLGGGHEGGAAWHQGCPNVGAGCFLDCSGLVNVAIYDVYRVDLREATTTEASDSQYWQHIPFSQVQPGDLVQPASRSGDHVDIIDHVSGNTLFVFGAHTSHPPQADEVGPASYGRSAGDLYLHYVGPGSSS